MISNFVIEPTMDYDFSKLYLGPPTTLSGGAYFTKIMHSTNKHLFIQTPKCLTKQGFIKSGKKMYADLMFDNNDTIFINWIENLETTCQELIFTKGQNWFETKLEKDDIETAFTSPFKIFKSGKYYLLRVNVNQNIKIYDEKNNILNHEDLSIDKHIISILEIQGIKFSSRNFQIEIELKQTMIVSPDPFLDECFIKRPTKQKQEEHKQEEHKQEEQDVLEDLINESVQSLNAQSLNAQSLKNTQTLEQNINLDVFDEEKEKEKEKDDDNIVLDIEELTTEYDEPKDELKEVDLLNLDNSLETITLKKPNQVYYEIYEKAREKAKDAKKNAIVAYLEMKNIKKTYMLDNIDESDSEFEEFADVDA
jgi:hypothetical protein